MEKASIKPWLFYTLDLWRGERMMSRLGRWHLNMMSLLDTWTLPRWKPDQMSLSSLHKMLDNLSINQTGTRVVALVHSSPPPHHHQTCVAAKNPTALAALFIWRLICSRLDRLNFTCSSPPQNHPLVCWSQFQPNSMKKQFYNNNNNNDEPVCSHS